MAIRTTPAPSPTQWPCARPAILKRGFGLNVEQEISKEVGLFARLGYDDGRNEIWAFTEIDQGASPGVVRTS